MDAALRSAASARETWRDATPAQRSLALLKIADAVEERAADLVEAECRNTGKPVALTMAEELPPCVDELRFFAGAARILQGSAAGEYMAGHTSMIRREPVGVCAQVTPWNYPLMMAIWKIAPALAAGNTVVLKPSDTTPVSTLMLAEIAAGFLPPGALNVVCGDAGTGRALVSHDIPQMVSITGSVRAGLQVAQAAAAGLKRVHLELGGKAPVVVFDDADVARAAEGIAGRRLQRGPGLHGGHPGAGRAGDRGRPDRRPGRAGARHQGGRAGPAGRRLRPAEQPGAAGPGRGLPQPRPGARRGGHRRPPGRGAGLLLRAHRGQFQASV